MRRQLLLTASYTCTDYQSQGQTIDAAIVDIGSPPSGKISAFNVYVALSQCRGRQSIQLLHDFDKKLLRTHPCQYLRVEDARLQVLERETERVWLTKEKREKRRSRD